MKCCKTVDYCAPLHLLKSLLLVYYCPLPRAPLENSPREKSSVGGSSPWWQPRLWKLFYWQWKSKYILRIQISNNYPIIYKHIHGQYTTIFAINDIYASELNGGPNILKVEGGAEGPVSPDLIYRKCTWWTIRGGRPPQPPFSESATVRAQECIIHYILLNKSYFIYCC